MKLLQKELGFVLHIIDTYILTLGTTTFGTEMGLKQGCPLSPLLFAPYISDIDRTSKLQKFVGTVIGLLSYADDIVLITESAEELKEMLRVIKRYTERKDMSVNTEKSKVLTYIYSAEQLKIINKILKCLICFYK